MKLCIIAYKIEADKGSEGGTAYHICQGLGKKLESPVLITREKYIHKLKVDSSFQNYDIIGIELPKILRFYKKRNRFFSLYYYLWCFYVVLVVLKMHKRHFFDVVHVLNFHTASFPHFIFRQSYKIVWGPVTNHFRVPVGFLSMTKDGILQFVKDLVKKINFILNPFILSAVLKSDLILFGMDKVPYPFAMFAKKIKFLPQAASVFRPSLLPLNKAEFKILYIGRMTSLKQPKLAAEAIALAAGDPVFKDMLLKADFIGDGPLFEKLAGAYKKTATICFYKQIKQTELQKHYHDSAVLLCPSFEAQGLVVAEAMSQGVVPLCWEEFGAAYLAGDAGVTISYLNDYRKAVNAFANQIVQLALEYKKDYESFARRRIKSIEQAKTLDWDAKAERIIGFYHDCLV